MDGIRNVQAWIEPWLAYLNYCFNHEPFSPVCGAFWQRAIIGVVIIGVIVVCGAALKYFSYRRKYAAALRAEEERNAIDEEAIKAHSWTGEKAYTTALGDQEIERRVREGIAQRRRQVGSS